MKLTVNGKDRTIDAPDDMPLLWVLRDILHLTGTKYGCGESLCGACTVHVDGRAVRSCSVTAASVAGKKVTTIEGLSVDGQHAVQRAWAEIDVVQCGYCQPGQIMSAAALIAERPRPTEAQIDAAMKGNICRCGAYERIRAAVVRAAELTGKRA